MAILSPNSGREKETRMAYTASNARNCPQFSDFCRKGFVSYFRYLKPPKVVYVAHNPNTFRQPFFSALMFWVSRITICGSKWSNKVGGIMAWYFSFSPPYNRWYRGWKMWFHSIFTMFHCHDYEVSSSKENVMKSEKYANVMQFLWFSSIACLLAL